MTTNEEMTLKAAEAFEAYYALGPTRSLRKLAEKSGVNVGQLERWSSKFGWRELCAERHLEEVNAARAAAKAEAAALARRRLRNAQLLQEAGLTILSKAKLMDMDEEAARKALGDARGMLEAGMRAERLELGEATDSIQAIHRPSKPISDMSDDELKEYILLLESGATSES